MELRESLVAWKTSCDHKMRVKAKKKLNEMEEKKGQRQSHHI